MRAIKTVANGIVRRSQFHSRLHSVVSADNVVRRHANVFRRRFSTTEQEATALSLLQVKGPLQRHVVTIPLKSTFKDVVKAMNDTQVGSLVVGTALKPLGIVTERDVIRVSADGVGESESVENIMTPLEKLVYVTPETSMNECMKLMNQYRIRHLLVREGTSIRGVISVKDCLLSVVHGYVCPRCWATELETQHSHDTYSE